MVGGVGDGCPGGVGECEVFEMSISDEDARAVYDVCAFAGTDNLEDALANWRAERVAMVEIQEHNRLLQSIVKKLFVVVSQSSKIFLKIVETTAMFLPPALLVDLRKAIVMIDELRKEYADL
jgi:hypothetical protein